MGTKTSNVLSGSSVVSDTRELSGFWVLSGSVELVGEGTKTVTVLFVCETDEEAKVVSLLPEVEPERW